MVSCRFMSKKRASRLLGKGPHCDLRSTVFQNPQASDATTGYHAIKQWGMVRERLRCLPVSSVDSVEV